MTRVGSGILEESNPLLRPCALVFLRRRRAREGLRTRQLEATRSPHFSAIVNFPCGAYAVIPQMLSTFEHHQVVKLTGTRGALWAALSFPGGHLIFSAAARGQTLKIRNNTTFQSSRDTLLGIRTSI